MMNDELSLSTGIPYIPVPDALKGNSFIVGVAPFKWGNGKYRLWPNTTRCNLNGSAQFHECAFRQSEYLSKDGRKKPLREIHTEETIYHKSSEHAYHTQKLLSYLEDLVLQHSENKIKILREMIQELTTLPKGAGEILLPKNSESSYESLVKAYLPKLEIQGEKPEFDKLCCADYHVKNPSRGINLTTNLPYNHERMELVLRMKMEQHPELKLQAKYLAYNNIMPLQYSGSDEVWASGKNGYGEGRLGLLIFTLGKHYLKLENGVDDGNYTYRNYEAAYNITIKGQIFFGHTNIDNLVKSNNFQTLQPRTFDQIPVTAPIVLPSSVVLPREQPLPIPSGGAILNQLPSVTRQPEPLIEKPVMLPVETPLPTLSQRPRF